MGYEDSEYLRRILKEHDKAKLSSSGYIVKLPCHPNIRVELTKAQDQFIVCPRCFKRSFITWSKREGGKKIEWEK